MGAVACQAPAVVAYLCARGADVNVRRNVSVVYQGVDVS